MAQISIIIPVYNAEKYIRQCLESLLNQTFQDIEIIAVDDCGTDHSVDIVREYASKDSRVVLMNQGQNMGPMVARQQGYSIANGEYIFFCDSDDTLPENSLTVLYQAAVESEADIVIGNISSVELDGRKSLWKREHLDFGTDRISVYKSLIKGDISHNLCAKLFKRELIVDYNYHTIANMRNGEDALLFYQLVGNCSKVITVDQIVYNYIQHSSSSTHIQISKENIDKIIMMKGFLYNEIFCKYEELEMIGGREIILRLLNWWANYPYYESRRFRSQLAKNGLSNLFKVSSIIDRFGFSGIICACSKMIIKGSLKRL